MRRLLAALLPGLFLLGFNIGTGSVTAMARAGSAYGLELLWTVALSCVITWRLIALYGRFTIVTGRTALQAFRHELHPAVGWFFIVALGVNVAGSVMGVMGVLAAVGADLLLRLTGWAPAPLACAAGLTGLVYLLFWRGRTRVFEQVLAALVALMGLCFFANAWLVAPPLHDILGGFRPRLPNVPGGELPLVLASMVGTTVFSGLFIVRTTLVKEAGWTLADARKQEIDAAVAAFLMFALSAAVMIAGAGALRPQGVILHDPTAFAALLEPLAGPAAAAICAIGLLAAGLSSQFPNIVLVPWLWCDYHQTPRDLRRPGLRVTAGLIALLGLTVPWLGARPVAVMLASQAFGALLLPVTVACLLILGRRTALMGEHRLGRADTVFLLGVLAFALFTAALGLRGFWTLLMAQFNGPV